MSRSRQISTQVASHLRNDFTALALLVAAVLVIPASGLASPLVAWAAEGDAGSITVDGNTTTYADYESLTSALSSLSGQSATVEMLRDWDAATGDVLISAFIVPTASNITFNMNGHLFNRNMTYTKNWGTNSAVIVESGAVLVINGGPDTIQHDVYVYEKTGRDDEPVVKDIFWGGLITGSAVKGNGGGIVVKDEAHVTLNTVGIIGCRAQVDGDNSGKGGGVYMTGKGAHLTLNTSGIEGCYAQNGGGIYAENIMGGSIDINDSYIDNNMVNGSGGGIYFNKTALDAFASGTSTIAGNKAGVRGGGVYIYGSTSKLKNIEISRNQANEGGGSFNSDQGGNSATFTFSHVEFLNNTATNQGGGLLVGDIGLALVDCTVTGNTAVRGAGLYVPPGINRDFEISGKSIIKDNYTRGGYMSNIDMTDSPAEGDRISFRLLDGSDVWISYTDISNWNAVQVTPADIVDTNCVEYIHSEEEGWHYEYLNGKIYRMHGDAPTPQDPQTVYSTDSFGAFNRVSDAPNKAGKVEGVVGDGGKWLSWWDIESGRERQFSKIRMFYGFGSQNNAAMVYYSDGLFYGSPLLYNEHLGNASWALAFSAGYLDTNEEAVNSGNIYYNKHAAGRQFLADIGCPDDKIYVNEANVTKPRTDTIGVIIGSKELTYADGTKTGDILVPVAIRGIGYDSEWVSNVTLGLTGEAQGFSEAATQVMDEIQRYLFEYGLKDAYEAGHVKFWITGFSRAGATANITAKRMIEKIETECTGETKSQVFAYTCEAPQGGTDADEQLDDKTKYFAIHNMINKIDLVPYVAPWQMGFKRYGVDHFIPGTDAYDYDGMNWDEYPSYVYVEETYKSVFKNVKTADKIDGKTKVQVTTYVDNVAYISKTSKYNAQRSKMLVQLNAVDPTYEFDDYFRPMAMDFIPKVKIYESGNYEGNPAEAYVSELIRFMQVGRYGGTNYKQQMVSCRADYVNKGTQEMAQTVMEIMYGDGFSLSADVPNMKYFTLADFLHFNSGTRSMYGVWNDCVGNWTGLSQKEKNKWTKYFWNEMLDQNAFEGMTDADIEKLHGVWPTLIDRAFTFVCQDYNDWPSSSWAAGNHEKMTYIPTFLTYGDMIISNHFPQVNIAWCRSSDEWYEGETDYYRMVDPVPTEKPKGIATNIDTGEQVELKEGMWQETKLLGSWKIEFVNDEIAGESVYYSLYDYDHEELERVWDIQQGGKVYGPPFGSDYSDYYIDVYDMSYGSKSPTARYNVTFYSASHSVSVEDPDVYDSDVGETISRQLERTVEGGKVTISMLDEHKDGEKALYYKNWKVQVINEFGDVVNEDISDKLNLKSNVAGDTLTFDMPKSGSDDFPYGYSLKIFTELGEMISFGRTLITPPVEGQTLQETCEVQWENGKTVSYPIQWRYLRTYHPEGTYDWVEYTEIAPVSGEAYQKTNYSLLVWIPKDMENDIVFDEYVQMSLGEDLVIVERFFWDGSLYLRLEFAPTGTNGGHAAPDDRFPLTVNALNLCTGEENGDVQNYRIEQGRQITLSAPALNQMRFVRWESDDIPMTDEQKYAQTTTVTIPELQVGDELHMTACFVPLINKVQANVTAPQVGQKLSQLPSSVDVTIEEIYGIHPDSLEMTWLPAANEGEDTTDGRIAKSRIEYTAAIKLKPNEDENGSYITVFDPDGDTQRMNAAYLYADEIEIEAVSDTEANTARIKAYSLDTNPNSDTFGTLFITFTAQNAILESVDLQARGDQVSRDVTADEILATLPATALLTMEDGSSLASAVEWAAPVRVYDDPDNEHSAFTWNVSGTVVKPDDVDNPNDVDLTVSISFRAPEAPHAASPVSSLASGTYLYDQQTRLSAEEGAVIYYTLDGSDPDENSLVYNGELISINRMADDLLDEMVPETVIDPETEEVIYTDEMIPTGRKALNLKAIAVVDGKWDSDIAVYEYVFDDVPVPAATSLVYSGDSQLAVKANPLYTLSVEEDAGGELGIDENGNVVVTDIGEYTVTATLNGYDHGSARWADDDNIKPDENDPSKVTFTISVDPSGPVRSPATVYVEVYPESAGEISGDTGSVPAGTATVAAAPTGEWEFVRWTRDGDDGWESVSDASVYSFDVSAGEIVELRANFAKPITLRWLDSAGNEIDSAIFVGLEGDKEPTTDKQPEKAATAQYSYEFAGWDEGSWNDDHDVKTYTPVYNETTNKYSVTFVGEDGSTIVKDAVEYDWGTPVDQIVIPDAPEKAASAESTYVFDKWISLDGADMAPVTADITYKPTYTATDRVYTVRFVDDDGDLLQATQYAYGQTPVYTKGTPTKEPDAQYTYTFDKWTPDIETVTQDAEYMATYTSTLNKYKVSFVDEDGSILKAEAEYDYGTKAEDIAKPADPTKAPTDQYTYTFAGWTPEIADVTEDVVYKASYSSTTNKYTVKFVDEDGTVLKDEASYDYGTAASDIAKPADPTKAADDKHTYTFAGWTPEIADVTANAVYKATYEAHDKPAEIGILIFDFAGGTIEGKTSMTIEVEVGDTFEILPAPVRSGYTFQYWEGSKYYPGDKYVVDGDHTFTAIWEENTQPGGDESGDDSGDNSGGNSGGNSGDNGGGNSGDNGGDNGNGGSADKNKTPSDANGTPGGSNANQGGTSAPAQGGKATDNITSTGDSLPLIPIAIGIGVAVVALIIGFVVRNRRK